MNWTEKVIEHIVQVRKEQGRSVLSLVKEFPDGAPARSTISQIESGVTKSMPLSHLEWWGRALGIDWPEFLKKIEEGKAPTPPMPKKVTINGVAYRMVPNG